MKKIYILILALAVLPALSSCSGFLDREPDRIMSDDLIFSDPVMIKSVLANYYGRVTWGQHVAEWNLFSYLDEAAISNGGPNKRSTFENDLWRVYDYALVRDFNLFLKGVRETTVLTEEEKAPIEGEVRFLRAWYYFNMTRGLGGMPIIGDKIFDYTPGMDVTALQYPRATEAEAYDYIISECNAIFNMLPEEKQVNSARANRWTAKMLEARAALYAGSIANYNNKMEKPLQNEGRSVGIPAEKAEEYYEIALAAAEEVIYKGPYILQDRKADKGLNFYEAVCVKDNNTEVIWARDYKYPGQTHGFTCKNAPASHAEDIDNSCIAAVLNLVEEYEEIDTDTPGQKSPFVTKENGTYKFYDDATSPFVGRDPRLWGTVIYPGALFKGTPVVLQTGQLVKNGGKWEVRLGELDSKDEEGRLITAKNGPKQSNEQFINKTGFYVRKYMDETTGAGTRGRGSEMWMPRFRVAEAYMIAAEASFELGNGQAETYINAVRRRAGVQELETVTFDNIVHEYRVEFAFEDHRYWDMKRWRLADKVWNGNNKDPQARHRRLWPYRVNAPGDENDGKWVFMEDFLFMSPNARYFKMQNYYNFVNMAWINNNPKMEKNPYQ